MILLPIWKWQIRAGLSKKPLDRKDWKVCVPALSDTTAISQSSDSTVLYPIRPVPVWIPHRGVRTTASLTLRALLGQSARATKNSVLAPGTVLDSSNLWGQGQGRCLTAELSGSPQRLGQLSLQYADYGCGRSRGGLSLSCLIRLDSAPHPSKR